MPSKVEKRGGFEESGPEENERIQYFEGAENPVMMTRFELSRVENELKNINHLRFYNTEFLCDYKMQWYPFDRQECLLVISMKPRDFPFLRFDSLALQ